MFKRRVFKGRAGLDTILRVRRGLSYDPMRCIICIILLKRCGFFLYVSTVEVSAANWNFAVVWPLGSLSSAALTAEAHARDINCGSTRTTATPLFTSGDITGHQHVSQL